MKLTNIISVVFLFGTITQLHAQKSQSDIDYQENRVQIFNDEERANVQYHFYEKTVALGLSDEVEAEYYRIVVTNVYAMARLNDKDQNNSEEEIRAKLKIILKEMNMEVKSILSKEQYNQHVKNFNDVLRSAYRVKNWEWDIDE